MDSFSMSQIPWCTNATLTFEDILCTRCYLVIDRWLLPRRRCFASAEPPTDRRIVTVRRIPELRRRGVVLARSSVSEATIFEVSRAFVSSSSILWHRVGSITTSPRAPRTRYPDVSVVARRTHQTVEHDARGDLRWEVTWPP